MPTPGKIEVSKELYDERYLPKQKIEKKISLYERKLSRSKRRKSRLIMQQKGFYIKNHVLETSLNDVTKNRNDLEKVIRDEKDITINKKKELKQKWIRNEISIEDYKNGAKDLNPLIEDFEYIESTKDRIDVLQLKSEILRTCLTSLYNKEDEILELKIKLQDIAKESNVNIDKTTDEFDKRIKHYKRRIKKWNKLLKTTNEDSIKMNCLEYHPDKNKWFLEGWYESNYTIEKWRMKYEKYSQDNNLFPEYFAIVKLFKEYYEEKNHPYPEIAMYRQRITSDMIQNTIEKIVRLGMEYELENEIYYLNLFKDNNMTPQTVLIKECNEHHYKNIIKNGKFVFKCPKHVRCHLKPNTACVRNDHFCCTIKLDSLKCTSGTHFKITLTEEGFVEHLSNYNIEFDEKDLVWRYRIENILKRK